MNPAESNEEPMWTRAILGIDAAWTDSQPSGIALVAESSLGWKCLAVAPSYSDFVSLAQSGFGIDWDERVFPGSPPDVDALMSAANALLGRSVDLVAVDIPMSYENIVGRRPSDQKISKVFGGKKCSAHSPNEFRPGAVGKTLMHGFERHGFSLATATKIPMGNVLIEVYPHPALLALMREDKRLPYKVGKSARLYPRCTKRERIEKLCALFLRILKELSRFIEVDSRLLSIPDPASIERISTLKRYEDAIDALVCAWVGVLYLEGQTLQMGGENDAICVPVDACKDIVSVDCK